GMELVLRKSPRLTGQTASGVERVQRRTLNGTPRAPAVVDPDGRIVAVSEPEDLSALRGAGVAFHLAATPEGTVPVHPDGSPGTQGALPGRVRFSPSRGASRVTPGLVGWIEGPETSRSALLVLASAVLQDPRGPSVLVLGSEGTPFRRFIQVGRTALG